MCYNFLMGGRMMKKKNGKLVMLLILSLVFTILTWFVAGGNYNDGIFVSAGITRAGLYDIFLIIYACIYYEIPNIFYLLCIGGAYGVLSNTKSYRKLVDKAVHAIKGKEILAVIVITLLMALYVSISNQLLTVMFLVPFIITVFIRRGCDRLTALSTAFGGMFIGTFGATLGTYGTQYMLTSLGVTIKDGIWYKVIIFLVAFALYNIFLILHMRKHKKKYALTKYDMFTTEKLDEKGTVKSKRQKVWPTVLVLALGILIALLAYIDWEGSFGVTFFSESYAKMGEKVVISEVPVINSLLGSSFAAFGEWSDLLVLAYLLVFVVIIVALINKMSISKFFEEFANGVKKISGPTFMYALAFGTFSVCYFFSWPVTTINSLFGNGKFNIFTLLLIAILIAVIFVNKEYIGFIFGSYFALTYAEHLVPTLIINQIAYGFFLVAGPTSFLIMFALTYLDIPYLKWLKHIWKFLLTMFIASLVILLLMCYL